MEREEDKYGKSTGRNPRSGFYNNGSRTCSTAMLADYGAEVIKIERPGRGEDGRKFPPMVDGESLTYCWFNRGKKSLAVDMKDPEGLELVKETDPYCTGDLREFPSRNHEEIWSGL